MLKTSKPTQEPAQSGRGGDGTGGEGVNKVLQPAQSVRLKGSIIVCEYTLWMMLYREFVLFQLMLT